MKDLTNIEICKQLSEIEGHYNLSESYRGDGLFLGLVKNVDYIDNWIFNPLTDDALCFGFIVTYKLYVKNINGIWRVWFNNGFEFVENEILNKAVCFSMIQGFDNAKT